MISIILVTYNRLHLLRSCVEQVLSRTSDATTQIVIWNNASTDGTRAYLDALTDPRLEIVHHEQNIGTNAFARAFARAREAYFIELDDDILDAPQDWDRLMLDAYRRSTDMGYLAADVIEDGKSVAAEIRYRRDAHLYTQRNDNGVNLLDGPTGGWCTMTSRAVYEQVGGFREDPRFTFWHEDGAYARAVQGAGYHYAVLEDLKVFHASGPAYTDDQSIADAKAKYYTWRDNRRKRRESVKRLLDAIPPVRLLNQRFGFYTRRAPG
ncbi:MAG: glycosyltransferase [Phycisphaeraceae bacterium]